MVSGGTGRTLENTRLAFWVATDVAAFVQIVMRDRITNKPRGFGFITFKEQEAADRACSDTHTLDGRTVSRSCNSMQPSPSKQPGTITDTLLLVQIDAKRSLPHGQHSSPKSKKIFVGGLAPETDEGAAVAAVLARQTSGIPACLVVTADASVCVHLCRDV